MAKKSRIIKSQRSLRGAKFSTRMKHRCWKCGRTGGYLRDFNLCRICFRELASQGAIPGIRKSSW